jgi:hypothetical protein
VFIRARDGGWKASHRIRLPKQAEFKDYAALAYRDRQLAIVSQASARLWVARVDEEARALVPGSDAVYRFPNKSYGNVEGIAWLSRDTLVAVSDRKKRGQPARCADAGLFLGRSARHRAAGYCFHFACSFARSSSRRTSELVNPRSIKTSSNA